MTKTMTKVNKYEEKMSHVWAEVDAHRHTEYALLQEAARIKALREKKAMELTRLNRVAYIAGFEGDPMFWRASEERSKEHGDHLPKDRVWQQSFEIETAEYHGDIHVFERGDLKRDKYTVEVVFRKRTFSAEPSQIHGGYLDYGYGVTKYGKDTLTQKYKTKEEALLAAEAWQDKLYTDHEESIIFDRVMYSNCKKAGYTFDSRRTNWKL